MNLRSRWSGHQPSLVFLQNPALAVDWHMLGPKILVVISGFQDALHLKLAACLPNARLIVRQFDISVAIMTTARTITRQVRVLRLSFRGPGAVPNSLQERLKQWDASCNYDYTTLHTFQGVSQTDHWQHRPNYHGGTYIVQMVKSQLSSVDISRYSHKAFGSPTCKVRASEAFEYGNLVYGNSGRA